MTVRLMEREAVFSPGLRALPALAFDCVQPIARCDWCDGEVFIDGERLKPDGSAGEHLVAHCEGCGRGWLVAFEMRVRSLDEGGGANMRGP